MKVSKNHRIFILLILIACLFLLFLNNIQLYYFKYESVVSAKNSIYNKYRKSGSYVINNNIAQYSVYLSRFDEPKYKIEAYLFFNSKYLVDNYKIENYVCLVKLLNLKTYNNSEEIIELKSIGTHSYYFGSNGKFIFEFSENDFHSYEIDATNFNVENIVIGVVRREDYRRDLNETEFNNLVKWEDIYLYEKIAFPFSLVNYQKPELMLNKSNELLKTVGSCVHFTYGCVASYLQNWIDIHLSLGISQIVIYDATPDYILTTFVYKNFDNRIKTIQYRINEIDLCENWNITEFPRIQELLKKYCLKFFELEFKDYRGGRFKHEQITSNDCFTQMSKKHEYVTYYDLDEFVYPRSFNMKFQPEFKCDDKKSFCSTNPFEVKGKQKNTTSYYNYLESLVEKYRDGRDKSKLASILFQHAAYHIPNKASEMLFNDLNQLIDNVKFNKTTFPTKVYLTYSTSPTKRHSFVVEAEDINHVKYISNAYNSIAKCLFENKLIKMNTTIDKTFQRYFYFITEPNQRWPKSIHYSKNSRALFIHFPTDTAPGSWELKPNFYDGHILPHYREDMNWFDGNFEGSIQKLNIDFEYLFFMIKKFTSQCVK